MANIVQPSNIPSLTVGGRVITDLVNLIILYGTSNGAGSSHSTFRRVNESAGYTPSGAKSFQCIALRSQGNVVSTSQSNIGYADNDVGLGVGTGFTNMVIRCPAIFQTVAVETEFQESYDLIIPNGKYGALDCQASGWAGVIILYGYEV